jgi:hypothetical protein
MVVQCITCPGLIATQNGHSLGPAHYLYDQPRYCDIVRMCSVPSFFRSLNWSLNSVIQAFTLLLVRTESQTEYLASL